MATASRDDDRVLRAAQAHGQCPKTGALRRRTAAAVATAEPQPERHRRLTALMVMLGVVVFIVFVLATMPGCAGIQEPYVRAMEDTEAAVAPDHRRYVEADATLTDEQRARRLAELDGWKATNAEARALVGPREAP